MSQLRFALMDGMGEPRRSRCRDCGREVLAVEYGEILVFAEAWEWEPLAPCRVCRSVSDRGNKRLHHCTRCHGTGWVGRARPRCKMLAINWERTCTVRYVSPRSSLEVGESAYELHLCQAAALAA